AKKNGNGWLARCPAHDDRHASLSVGVGDDGRLLVYCHAGCGVDAIVKALGIRQADLYPNSSAQWNGQSQKDWPALASRFSDALPPERRAELATSLGLPEWSFTKLPVGWCESDQCWTLPECDGQGRIIGISRRYRDGTKKAMADSKRGLIGPANWDK